MRRATRRSRVIGTAEGEAQGRVKRGVSLEDVALAVGLAPTTKKQHGC